MRTVRPTAESRHPWASGRRARVFVHFAPWAAAGAREDVKAAVGLDKVDVREERGTVYVARLGRGAGLREGDSARLRVAPDRLHFFDPATGLGIYRS
jgi:hypothetical protein